jgi:hypothetical protein
MLSLILLPLTGFSDVLAAWDVLGVDVADLPSGAPYGFGSTTSHSSGKATGELTLGAGVNPTTSADQYGFKVSAADEQTTFAGAVDNNHFIQFTLEADVGYRFDLTSIELNGESSGTGADSIALTSDIDGFSSGSEIATLSGRQGITGGWDTDASGWGAPIDLSGVQYQNQTSVTFRLYGWNSSSGSGITYIRNLSGDDLVVNGTVEAIPEPAVMGFISLVGIGALITKRFV